MQVWIGIFCGDCPGFWFFFITWPYLAFDNGFTHFEVDPHFHGVPGLDIPGEVRELADRRWAARSAKDWAASDVLRDELAALGWVAKDGREGYTLEKSKG